MGRGRVRTKQSNSLSPNNLRSSKESVEVAAAAPEDIPELIACKTETVREAFGKLYPDRVEEYISKNCSKNILITELVEAAIKYLKPSIVTIK